MKETIMNKFKFMFYYLCFISIHTNNICMENTSAVNSKLVKASNEGDLNKVIKAIKSGANVNSIALIIAAEKGHENIVKFLLDVGANPNIMESYGNTSLIAASEANNEEIVKLLLKFGADVNHQYLNEEHITAESDTALMKAAKRGNENIIKILLESGARVNLRNKKHYTALIYAAQNGSENIVKLLLAAGGCDLRSVSNLGPFEPSAINAAKIRGFDNIIKIIETAKKLKEISKETAITAIINAKKTKLFDAIKTGDYSSVKELLSIISLGIYDNQGNNPLHLAIIAPDNPNKLEIFKLILSTRPQLAQEENNLGKTPIDLAPNNPVILKFLLYQ